MLCVPTKLTFYSESAICWALADSLKSFPVINHRKITRFWAQADLAKDLAKLAKLLKGTLSKFHVRFFVKG